MRFFKSLVKADGQDNWLACKCCCSIFLCFLATPLKNEMMGLRNGVFGDRMGNGSTIVESLVEEVKEGNSLKLSRISKFQN